MILQIKPCYIVEWYEENIEYNRFYYFYHYKIKYHSGFLYQKISSNKYPEKLSICNEPMSFMNQKFYKKEG